MPKNYICREIIPDTPNDFDLLYNDYKLNYLNKKKYDLLKVDAKEKEKPCEKYFLLDKKWLANRKTTRAYWKDEASILFVNNALDKIKNYNINKIIDYVNNPKNAHFDDYLFLIRLSDKVTVASGRDPVIVPSNFEDQSTLSKNVTCKVARILKKNKSAFVEYPWESPLLDILYAKTSYVVKIKVDNKYYALGSGYPLIDIDC